MKMMLVILFGLMLSACLSFSCGMLLAHGGRDVVYRECR